ncbi:uncharacterized protein F4822DRAFT_423468 [Hypoxylon trugodes]|uniref:uncharacterized protein n=1 Tax=Hypoxylon trugodes TaxID=326681 RepID=UPI00218E7461|nr:uncharacterized protein F4822DRAFT_423468 [Hypoxylon trugodes]KAI1382570.1 hypothetical protein F4822DRAFT_423468 [Hypoxylon trugodes]
MSQSIQDKRRQLIDNIDAYVDSLHGKALSGFVEETGMANLNVKYHGIDVDSGTPNDGGPKFLDLNSVKEMKELAAKQGNLEQISSQSSRHPYNLDAAEKLGVVYDGWHESIQPVPGEKQREPPLWKKLTGDHYQYKTDELVWRSIFTLRVRDHSRPDTVCFLANKDLFKDNQLFVSELTCILGKAKYGLAHHEDGKHLIVPVTVVSAAGRLARIVQGYVDPNTFEIMVRVSEIVDIDRTDEENKEAILKVGCWLFGTPSEETTS